MCVVSLGSTGRGMPHEDRDGFDRIDSAIQQILAIGSPEGSRIAGHAAILLADREDAEDAVRRQIAGLIGDDRCEHSLRIDDIRRTKTKIVLDYRMELRSDKNDARMPVRVLAFDMDDSEDPGFRIEIIEIQKTEFLGTKPCSQKESDDRIGTDHGEIIRIGVGIHASNETAAIRLRKRSVTRVGSDGTGERIPAHALTDGRISDEIEEDRQSIHFMSILLVGISERTALGKVDPNIIGSHSVR